MLSEKFDKALGVASDWHREQRRKNGTPYLGHLIAVSAIILKNGGDEEQAIAGLLHDSVEDQGKSLIEIADLFGDRVAHLVEAVSEDKSLPKAERKRLYAQAVGQASAEVQLVSAADKLDNLRDYRLDSPSLQTEDVRLFYEKLLDAYNQAPVGIMAEMRSIYQEIWRN